MPIVSAVYDGRDLHPEVKKYFISIGAKNTDGYIRLLKEFMECVTNAKSTRVWAESQYNCLDAIEYIEYYMDVAREIARDEELDAE